MRFTVCVVLSALYSGAVTATPVTWYVQDAVLDDGGVATGYFVYDADSGIYLDYALETTAGSEFTGASWGGGDIVFYEPTQLRLAKLGYCDPLEIQCPGYNGEQGLLLGFDASLTNAGGVIGLGGGEFTCGDDSCEVVGGPVRSFISGSVSSVPIPAAVWLFGSALAGLGWLRRRKPSN
jgi:hypothetical protein